MNEGTMTQHYSILELSLATYAELREKIMVLSGEHLLDDEGREVMYVHGVRFATTQQAIEHGPRCCARCEYFDGGGLGKVERAMRDNAPLHGDCLNRLSPRFQTTSNDTCLQFVRECDGESI